MFIEDILEKFVLSGLSGVSRFDKNILSSLYSQSWSMTENQKKLLEKLLNRYKHLIEQIFQKNVDFDLQFPKYRRESRVKSLSKKISLIREPLVDSFIKIEFPYDPTIIQEIQTNKRTLLNARWDQDNKYWKLALMEKNLDFCRNLSQKFEFEITKEIREFFDQYENLSKNIDQYIPMIDECNQTYFFKNFPYFTENLGNELIPALFTARKYAVTYWSDSIEKEIENSTFDPLMRNFLKNPVHTKFEVNLDKNSLISLKNILRFLTPCLVVLPVGEELDNLKLSLDILNGLGIDNTEISVMFRLSNSKNSDFNSFVREHKLNLPVSQDTKVIFISNKIPKPLIEQKLYFHSVITYNYHHAHYTIINYLRNHHNIIQINKHNETM